MNHKMLEVFEDCPVIAAVKDEEGLKKCLESEIPIVFVLYGDICSISEIVSRLKKAGKIVIVHLDLLTGLSSKEIAVTYLKSVTHADGLISTKPGIIKKAKEEGMFAIMRFFVIDSIAYESIRKQTESVRPDMIEILPGLMPKVIRHICRDSIVPVIAGGLITDREDIMGALGASHKLYVFNTLIASSKEVGSGRHISGQGISGGAVSKVNVITLAGCPY